MITAVGTSPLDSPPLLAGREEPAVPPPEPAEPAVTPRLSPALRLQIVATLVGGTLLLCSLAAGWLWKQPFFAALPAAVAMLLLGTPLVAAAVRDLVAGKAG